MTLPALGVVIVSFNSSDVILDCLGTLLAAPGVRLHVVVVDNASTDGTPALVRDWASGRVPHRVADDLPFEARPLPRPVAMEGPEAPLHLIEAGVNGGYGAGVNIGLSYLSGIDGLDRFWILNPDAVVPPATPRAFATHDEGKPFALMGGRVTYYEPADMIQMDGGTLDRRTGVTGNLNLGASFATTPPPDPSRIDFISGANMVVSRAHYETAGPMAEDYFLYYEEIDWSMRRGALPLAFCPTARIHHRAGTAIGSPTLARIASPFSIYFLHRARMRFMRRFHPEALPTAWAYSLAKAAQLLARGYPAQARALIAGARDAALPRAVRDRLGPEASRRAAR